MSIREKTWFPILYMFVVTAVASSALVGLAAYTKDRVKANAQLAFEQAALEAVGAEIPKGVSTVQVHQQFLSQLSGPKEELAGAYIYQKSGQTAGYAVPFEGQGFWAPIKGIIGFAADGRTITGVSFYEQNETPGLGAQITTVDFRDRFKNKQISAAGQALRIREVGAELKENEVHAVTGATQTSTRLDKLMNDSLIQWQEVIQNRQIK